MRVGLPEGDPVSREAAPGELLAVTHAMFMAWALAEVLADAGSPASELVVEADCTLAGPVAERELVAVDLRVYGRGSGLSVEGFREAANAARLRYVRIGRPGGHPWRDGGCLGRRCAASSGRIVPSATNSMTADWCRSADLARVISDLVRRTSGC
jgi:hypothetical protein